MLYILLYFSTVCQDISSRVKEEKKEGRERGRKGEKKEGKRQRKSRGEQERGGNVCEEAVY